MARLQKAFGQSISDRERRRLATAVFAYRDLSRGDDARINHLRFQPDWETTAQDLRFVAGNAESLLILVPPSPFPGIARLIVAELAGALAAAAPGVQVAFRTIPSPSLSDGLPSGSIEQIVSDAVCRNIVLIGLHPIRTGVTSVRFTLPKRLEMTSESVATFLDDCLRENPAQYDWFEMR